MIASERQRLIQVSVFAVALFVCYKNFHHTSSPDLQFKSFANFSNYKDVIIPIHPQWPTYPGWHIDASPSVKKPLRPINEKQISLSPISASGADTEFSNEKLHITSTSNDPILMFANAIVCETASDVALEIDLVRSAEGWMQLFWSKDNNFSETNSLKRWYPAGPVKAQFAFPNFQGGTYVRFDPLELEGNAEITKLTAYCLP